MVSLSQAFASSDLPKPIKKAKLSFFLPLNIRLILGGQLLLKLTMYYLQFFLVLVHLGKSLNYLFLLKLIKYFFYLIAANEICQIYNQIRIWPLFYLFQEKQSVSFRNAKSQTSTKRSKHSGTSSIARPASRLMESRVELELARFQKKQNENGMKEEEKMRRQEEEMHRKEEEMRG